MAKKKKKKDIEARRTAAAKRRIDAFHKREEERRQGNKPRKHGIVIPPPTTQEWILDWNCVMFKTGYVIIYSRSDMSVQFKPTKIDVPQALESFNYLRGYLNNKLAYVRCCINNKRLMVIDQISFDEAIQKFEIAARQGVIGVGGARPGRVLAPRSMSFDEALSKAQKMTPEEFKIYKSEFISFLIKLQDPRYKVITCNERLAHANSDNTERAFMFSLKCQSGKILIVHENLNPDRSTLIFVVNEPNYTKSIRRIYNFLQSAEINKRSNLRRGSIEIGGTGVITYKSINHDSLSSWQAYINRCVSFGGAKR